MTLVDTVNSFSTAILRVSSADIHFTGDINNSSVHYTNQITKENIQKAAKLLSNSQVVAFPTETVFGLGANALNHSAVEKIYQAKKRPSDNPLIVHISSLCMLRRILPNGEIPKYYDSLIQEFWPGPLTLLFPRDKNIIPDSVCLNHPTVAVRFPAHPIARALIHECNFPLAAPSANASGRPSPTRAQHVYSDLNNRIPLILDDGHVLDVGIESTVVDGYIHNSPPLILRPGMITASMIRKIGGDFWKNVVEYKSHGGKLESNPSTPGMKYTHYKPNADLILLAVSMGTTLDIFMKNVLEVIRNLDSNAKLGVIKIGNIFKWPKLPENVHCINLIKDTLDTKMDAEQVARYLFSAIRELDDVQHCSVILVQGLPEIEQGIAVMNRLSKAASTIIRM